MLKSFFEQYSIPLFSSLKDEELELLSRNLDELKFEKGEKIISEGAEGDCFYLLKSGMVKVVTTDPRSGEETVLSHLDPGDYFGEMALITDEPRSASVISETEVEVITLSKDKFKELIKTNPDITLSLTHMLSHRLKQTNKTLKESQRYYKDRFIPHGTLEEDMEVISLLKYVEENSLTGILDLKQNDDVARFNFRKGNLLDLDYKDMNESDAMDEILKWKNVEYIIKPELLKFEPTPVKPAESQQAVEQVQEDVFQREIPFESEIAPSEPEGAVAKEENSEDQEDEGETEAEAEQENSQAEAGSEQEQSLDAEIETVSAEESEAVDTEDIFEKNEKLPADLEENQDISESDDEPPDRTESTISESDQLSGVGSDDKVVGEEQEESDKPEVESSDETDTDLSETIEDSEVSSEPETAEQEDLVDDSELAEKEEPEPLPEIPVTELFEKYLFEKMSEFNRFAGLQVTKNALRQSYHKFKDYFEVVNDISVESSPEVRIGIIADKWTEKHTLFCAVLLRDLANSIEREVVGVEFWSPESINPANNHQLEKVSFFEYFEQATDFLQI